jgi:hypothetical protein
MGLPVRRFQITTVSRWLVMPMAFTDPAFTFALRSADLHTPSTPFQISSGSCSTQPDFG